MNYATGHELEEADVQAAVSATHFGRATGAAVDEGDAKLLGEVAAEVTEPLSEALAAAQDDDEPCWCPACIAEAASPN